MFEDFKKGWELYLETFPFVTARLMVYGILSLGGFFYSAMCVGMIVIIENRWFVAGIIGVSIAGLWGAIQLLRKGPLYRLKVAHVAVISEIFKQGEVPQGKTQIIFGKSRALHKYRTQKNIELLEPLPQHLIRFFKKSDGLMLRGGDDSASLLQLSSLLTLLSLVAWGAFMVVLSPPIWGLVSLVPTLTPLMIGTVVYGAWILKLILVDPFVLTTKMATHLKRGC